MLIVKHPCGYAVHLDPPVGGPSGGRVHGFTQDMGHHTTEVT